MTKKTNKKLFILSRSVVSTAFGMNFCLRARIQICSRSDLFYDISVQTPLYIKRKVSPNALLTTKITNYLSVPTIHILKAKKGPPQTLHLLLCK